MKLTLEQMKNEWKKYILGNTLQEYLKIKRIGETYKVDRKYRKELYKSLHIAADSGVWDEFFFPSKYKFSSYDADTYNAEQRILERQERQLHPDLN